MNDILSHSEKQLVIYSKGHFKGTNFHDDLRCIVAETFGIPVESTMFYHVYNFVVKIFLKLQESKYIQESMEDFLCALFKWDDNLTPEGMLKKMVSLISTVKVAGLNVGEADSSYLPVKTR